MPILANPLDDVLGSRVKLSVLRVLYGRREPISARELARGAKFSHPTVLQALDDLVATGIVRETRSGGQRLCQLNTAHDLARSVLAPIFDAEWEWSTDLLTAVRQAIVGGNQRKPKDITAFVFGSAARGTDTPASDFDLLVLVDDRVTAIRVKAKLAEATPRIQPRFGIRLAPVVLVRAEARRRFARGDALLHTAAREARTLIGTRDLQEELHGSAHK